MMNEDYKGRRFSGQNTGPGETAAPVQPVTQTQIANIHRMIDIIAKTAESCDLSLAKHVTTQGHQIKALEEAICPRVAARLAALERRTEGLTNYLDKTNFPTPDSLVSRMQFLENAVAALQGPVINKPSPAASPPGFMVGDIGYTVEEGRVAAIIAGGPIRFTADFKKAREIVDLLRGS